MKLRWYLYRLRAMRPAEVAKHLRQKLFPIRPPKALISLESARPVPLGPRKDAEGIKRIIAGRWKAFAKLPIQVDDPPRWNYDYLAGMEVPNSGKVNHRELPKNADIKMIWELSRWYELLRLAEGEIGRASCRERV